VISFLTTLFFPEEYPGVIAEEARQLWSEAHT
jgi:hypothetical protein